jgi:hypothetical protein
MPRALAPCSESRPSQAADATYPYVALTAPDTELTPPKGQPSAPLASWPLPSRGTVWIVGWQGEWDGFRAAVMAALPQMRENSNRASVKRFYPARRTRPVRSSGPTPTRRACPTSLKSESNTDGAERSGSISNGSWPNEGLRQHEDGRTVPEPPLHLTAVAGVQRGGTILDFARELTCHRRVTA